MVKDAVLSYLEKHRGESVSGEQLAQMLNVSRAAVWKAVRQLKEEGALIEAVSNRGYCLSQESDLVSQQAIFEQLPIKYRGCKVMVYDVVDSTNNVAKQLVMQHCADKTVVVAEEQSAGRGRFGNQFFSPNKTGVYISVVLRPNVTLTASLPITMAAGVAVCRAVESLTGKQAKIKWVNDVFVEEKKICGILTEAISDFESGMVEAVVVGIGINLKTMQEDFPDELQGIAGSLQANSLPRSAMIAAVCANLFELTASILHPDEQSVLSYESLLGEYRDRSLILGRMVSCNRRGEVLSGKAVAIDEQGRLILETQSGEVALDSGEVSLGSGWK